MKDIVPPVFNSWEWNFHIQVLEFIEGCSMCALLRIRVPTWSFISEMQQRKVYTNSFCVSNPNQVNPGLSRTGPLKGRVYTGQQY
jgi:hypothetical protein